MKNERPYRRLPEIRLSVTGTIKVMVAAAAIVLSSAGEGGLAPRAGELEEDSVQVPDLRVVGWLVDDAAGGNGDLGLHPGETARLSVYLSNRGNEPARGVAGQLFEVVDHPDVEVLDKLAVWPDLAATGEPAPSSTPHFEVRVATTRPCAWRIPLRLELTADGGYEQTEFFVLEMVDPRSTDLATGAARPLIYGADFGDNLGEKVAAGDLNGDGFDDLVLASSGSGPDNDRGNAGEVTVIYGGPAGLPDADLAAPPSGVAFIYGAESGDGLGSALATGDLDGDGFDDLVLGADGGDGPANARSAAGDVVVIYGGPSPLTSVDLAGPSGVARIYGVGSFDLLGSSVATGDLDGNGFDDLILGSRGGDGPANGRDFAGEVAVIYCGPSRLSTVDLAAPPPGVAFVYGADIEDKLGLSVATADLDGDGFDDLILSASDGNGPDNASSNAGEVAVIYGGPAQLTSIDLAAPPPDVALIYGADSLSHLGFSVATGDLDGNGFDDLVLGATDSDSTGHVAVIYGGTARLSSADLATPPPGVALVYGADLGDRFGFSVATGDLDGDGFDDLVLGAIVGDGPANARNGSGEVAVIHGGPSPLTIVDLGTPRPDVAFIYAANSLDQLGQSVATGDADGDGFDDLVLGAATANGPANARHGAGEVALIPGGPRSRYRHEPATFAFIDATLGTDLGLACDDCSVTIPIGFSFDWFGTAQTEVTVSSNGYLTFGGPGDRLPSFCPPRSGLPNDLIAAFWEDLDPSEGGGVFTLLEGAAPNRRLTIEWAGVPLFGGIGDATFEVTLLETSDQILMQYQDVVFGTGADHGGTAIVALENAKGVNGTTHSCFSPEVASGSAAQFRRFASPTVIHAEDVESGVAGWTSTGLWHIVTAPTCGPASRSGSSSFYYGQNSTCDYDTGVANSGTLTSPVIGALPLPQDAELSFWHRRAAELDIDFDQSFVQAQGDGGGFTPQVQVTGATNAWRFSGDDLPVDPTVGHVSTVDLGGFVGQDLKLRFTFDTVDENENSTLGWMVDDITVTACPVFDSESWTSTAVASQAVATAQPDAICETAMGRVDAAGSYCSGCGDALTYQWSRDGAPISGAIGAIYDIPTGETPGSREFSVAIDCATNPACADVSEPAAVSVVPEPVVGATLMVERSGANLLILWEDVAGAEDYVLLSSLTPDGAFDTQVATAGSSVVGISAPMPSAASVYYLVAGRNAICGVGEIHNFRTP